MNNARLAWIDMGRGIAMFLVILFHTENSLRGGGYNIEHYSMVYHSFFLPLFFFLSGYVFTTDYRSFSFKKKIEQITRGIVLPYFIFTVLILVPKSIFHGIPLLNGVKDIFLGYASWFITSLGITQVLFAVILSQTKAIKIHIIIACLLLFCGFLIKTVYPYRLPFYLNYIPIVYIWIFMGLLYRIYERRLAILTKPLCVICLFLLYSVAIWLDMKYFCTTLNLFEPRILVYNNYLLSIIYSIIGIVMMVGVLKILPNVRVISFIGINSLTIYYINGGICKITAMLINKTDYFLHPRQTYIGVILVAVLCTSIAACIAYFIRKYFPLLVGDKMAFDRFKKCFLINEYKL